MLNKNLIFVEGKRILYISFVLIFVFIAFNFYYFAFIITIFLAFAFYFFRNPDRDTQDLIISSNTAICPCDGIVVSIKENQQIDIDNQIFNKKISIFLSPLDVHVNWIPISGKISKIKYKPGKFMFAFIEKSSELNERNDILIETDKINNKLRKVLVRQIAGTIARKIVCWKKPGDLVTIGQKYGMIKFGSRIEVFVDAEFQFEVSAGQKVYGGRTILGKWL